MTIYTTARYGALLTATAFKELGIRACKKGEKKLLWNVNGLTKDEEDLFVYLSDRVDDKDSMLSDDGRDTAWGVEKLDDPWGKYLYFMPAPSAEQIYGPNRCISYSASVSDMHVFFDVLGDLEEMGIEAFALPEVD